MDVIGMLTESNWALLVVFIVVLALIKWHHRPRKFPPGPRGIPVLGYLPFMGKMPEKTAYELSKRYGPLMSIRFGSNDMVFLNDYDTIVKAFVKAGDIFSGRPPFVLLEDLKAGHGLAFINSGEKHKSQRKFGLMTLRGFGVGKKGMENICIEESQYLNEEIRKQNGKPFNISPLLHNAVSNNICHVAFGRRFTYNDKLFKQMMNIVIEAFEDKLTGFVNLCVTLVPFLTNVPPFSTLSKRFTGSITTIFDWVGEIANEHRETFDENNLRDFIDAFILEQKKRSDPHFTDFQLQNFIHELFVAGTGTASNTLYWAILCLIHYPEAQKKLREEIMKELGSSGNPSMSKKVDLPYTSAFVLEVFRFRTVTPLGLLHKTTEDVEMNGYFIPKNTIVQANIWAAHNDTKFWKNPEVFNPERFLDKEGKFINSNHVIPFSVGPRHCLGEQLARMEVYTFLVGMVQKFEFLPDPNANEMPIIKDGTRSLGFGPIPYEIVAKEL